MKITQETTKEVSEQKTIEIFDFIKATYSQNMNLISHKELILFVSITVYDT